VKVKMLLRLAMGEDATVGRGVCSAIACEMDGEVKLSRHWLGCT
jgi:hypothetical protein